MGPDVRGDRSLLVQSGAHSLGMCSARYAAVELVQAPFAALWPLRWLGCNPGDRTTVRTG
eukprot:6400709-Amphidinium_carterae.1